MGIFRSSNPSPSIKFICEPNLIDAIPAPFPAAKNIPKWYRNLRPDIAPETPQDFPGQTIKTCMPVLDAFSAGYLIPLAAPIRMVSEGKGNVTGTWRPDSLKLLESHSENQIGRESDLEPPYLKWINYWGIQLPEGYSALFIPPVNQGNRLFECLSAVVDCDRYNNVINFPFRWTGPDHYDGMIPAGTPLVQVIPFKRESWVMDAAAGTPEEMAQRDRILNRIRTAPHGYRDQYRSQKIWRSTHRGSDPSTEGRMESCSTPQDQ